MFLECENDNITSYGEGTTPNFCAQDISSVISELRRIAKKVFECFKNNHMKAYPGKRHGILGSNTQKEIHSDNTSIASSLNEKLVGKIISIKFAIWLTKTKCSTSNYKPYERIRKKNLIRAFIKSQFSYGPLSQLHEKALRNVYGDYKPKFDEQLEKGGSFSIRHRNIQALAIQIYKSLSGLSWQIMNEVF